VLGYGLSNITFEFPIHVFAQNNDFLLQINFFFKFQSNPWGQNMVKKIIDAKVKVLFQELHMTCVIFVLVYNFKFCILDI